MPLSIFLDEIEAKYEDVTVMAMCAEKGNGVNAVVLTGQCDEELVPGSQDRGRATQFAWAFRWMFAKCQRGQIGRAYDCLLLEVD